MCLLFISQIFYKSGRLRIAITTANLVPLDWRDIENVSFKEKTRIPHLECLTCANVLDRLGAGCSLTRRTNRKGLPSTGLPKPS